jgi:hypothetical protein
MRPQRVTLIALALIMLLGGFLRFYKLDFGMELPYVAHTDEPTQFNPAIRILTTGDLNPRFFAYPSLPIYLYSAVMGVGYLVGRLLGLFQSVLDLQPVETLQMSVGIYRTPQLLLLARGTSALLGTLTIGLAYVLGRRQSRIETPLAATGLFVALLVALSREHVRLSHYMAVDVMATLFCIACLTACTLALSGPAGKRKTGWLWAAAALGGLSTSCKYNYALLAIPVAMACLLDPRVGGDKRFARLTLCGLLFVGAFLAGSPYMLLDMEAAWKGVQAELEHYASGHLGQTGNSYLWYLDYFWQVNPFYLILGIPGLALAIKRYRRSALPWTVFAGIYFWLIGRQAVHFGRNALPVMVLLMAGVGVTGEALVSWLPGRVRGWRLRAGRRTVSGAALAAALLALIALLPSLISLPALLAPPRPSGKAQAQAWFDEQFDTQAGRRYIRNRGGRPLRFIAESYTVYLNPSRVHVDYVTSMTHVRRAGSKQMIRGPEDLVALGYDVALLGTGMFRRFYANADAFPEQVALYDALLGTETVAFDQGDDVLAFRGEAGLQVYVVFLTEDARAFAAAVAAADAEAGPGP